MSAAGNKRGGAAASGGAAAAVAAHEDTLADEVAEHRARLDGLHAEFPPSMMGHHWAHQ